MWLKILSELGFVKICLILLLYLLTLILEHKEFLLSGSLHHVIINCGNFFLHLRSYIEMVIFLRLPFDFVL